MAKRVWIHLHFKNQSNVLYTIFPTNPHRNQGLANQAGSVQCKGYCEGRGGNIFSAIHAKIYSEFLVAPTMWFSYSWPLNSLLSEILRPVRCNSILSWQKIRLSSISRLHWLIETRFMQIACLKIRQHAEWHSGTRLSSTLLHCEHDNDLSCLVVELLKLPSSS